MLARAVEAHLRPGARALELCAGSGAVAVTAAMAGATGVTAVDISRRAVLSTRLAARLNGVRVDARRGELFAPVSGARFDLVAANPPYVPAPTDDLPRRGKARAWDAGRSGRLVLDRIIAEVPSHLAEGGVVLLVHSSVCGVDATLEGLRAGGLDADVAERRRGPLGPLMRARIAQMEAAGMLAPGERHEDVVIVRGRRTGAPAASASASAAAPVSA